MASAHETSSVPVARAANRLADDVRVQESRSLEIDRPSQRAVTLELKFHFAERRSEKEVDEFDSGRCRSAHDLGFEQLP